jgi:hypothetical protein
VRPGEGQALVQRRQGLTWLWACAAVVKPQWNVPMPVQPIRPAFAITADVTPDPYLVVRERQLEAGPTRGGKRLKHLVDGQNHKYDKNRCEDDMLSTFGMDERGSLR